MHKAIKFVCYQNSANYRKPASIDVQESYKFPPYSTVIGMVHKLCGFTEYKPMLISIQGNYKSAIFNMYTRHFLGKGKDAYIRGLGYAEFIIDVDLIIHIKPEDESLFSVCYRRRIKKSKHISVIGQTRGYFKN